MREQFVTYEIALKLKELGFDEKCFSKWVKGIGRNSCVLHDIEENVDYAYSSQRETMLKALELCQNKK